MEIFSAARSPERHAYKVRDLMKTDFPTILPRADLFEDGLKVLQENDFGTVLVVEDGELVGMLGMEDIGQASLLRRHRKDGGRAGRT